MRVAWSDSRSRCYPREWTSKSGFSCASPRSTWGRTRRGCSSRTSTTAGSTRSSRGTAITRLGEGVDARRRLLPLPIARVRNCLADYRRELESLGAERALLVATSAVRDAENGEAFLGEIEWSYGFTTRLLTGEEEAELTFRGVGDRRRRTTLVLDIGGGSTELDRRRGRRRVEHSTSARFG